jgi:hypothetical protein
MIKQKASSVGEKRANGSKENQNLEIKPDNEDLMSDPIVQRSSDGNFCWLISATTKTTGRMQEDEMHHARRNVLQLHCNQ